MAIPICQTPPGTNICRPSPLGFGNLNETTAFWTVAVPDTYTITMTTTDNNGHVLSTATMTVNAPKEP